MKAKESVFIDKKLEQKILDNKVEIHLPNEVHVEEPSDK